MEVKILDLTRQYEIIREEVEEAVLKQMRSGMYIMGSAVSEFEKKFAEQVGVRYAISVNSGTDALMIAMKALGIGAGDEVITTPFTFFATAETVAAIGATPVFVDIDERTYNIDPERIEERITEKTKAILPVHIFGQPANMNRIAEIAQKHGLFVIEDACQAVGASYEGKMAGSIGDAGCFSFFPTKNLGAFGDAGMITTDSEELATVCRAFREHGMAQNGAKARTILEGIEDELSGTVSPNSLYNPYKYYNYLIANNSRMDAIQAVILNVKLKYLERFNARRTEIAQYYNRELENVPEITLPGIADNVKTVWHQYAFCCDDKDAMGEFLANQNVGSAAFYPVPLHLQKAFVNLGYGEGDLPVAERITKRTVCLPIYPELRREELEYVVECIRRFYEK